MSETPSQQRTTPARRRNYRQGTRPAAHKAYASENDAATLEATRQKLNSPQTPNKASLNSNTTNGFPSKRIQSSKSKAKNKPKSKQGLTFSPDHASVAGQTPPHPPISIKSGMNTAFAGATFHASPAPSALPIPSFLSKSSLESPVATARYFTEEPSPPTTDQDAPTPFRASSVPRTNESPLDFMFRAHREEKERHSREIGSGWDDVKRESPRPFSPPDANGFSKTRSLPHQKRSSLRPQSSGLDTFELDGTPGRPLGPAFSTPYQERIKAARAGTNSNLSHNGPPTETPLNHGPADDSTNALKKFLFGNTASFRNGSASLPPESQFPSSLNQDSSGSAPRLAETRPVERRSNIEAMENDLRRILKLDVSSNSPSANRIF